MYGEKDGPAEPIYIVQYCVENKQPHVNLSTVWLPKTESLVDNPMYTGIVVFIYISE